MPIEVFYGTIDEPLTRSEAVFARAICQACPVLMDCALSALQAREPFGLWAGSTPTQRQHLLRRNKGNVTQSAIQLTQEVLQMGGGHEQRAADE